MYLSNILKVGPNTVITPEKITAAGGFPAAMLNEEY